MERIYDEENENIKNQLKSLIRAEIIQEKMQTKTPINPFHVISVILHLN